MIPKKYWVIYELTQAFFAQNLLYGEKKKKGRNQKLVLNSTGLFSFIQIKLKIGILKNVFDGFCFFQKHHQISLSSYMGTSTFYKIQIGAI